jgi:hypothetical protein
MAANAKLFDLRNLLAERFPQAPLETSARRRTGVFLIDSVLDQGLPQSAITEISSPFPSAGSASLIAGLIGAAQAARSFVALIDGRDSFDPEPFARAGLRHLLWVRCHRAMEALKAADLLLRDGNFPLLLLDLVLNSPNELRQIPQTSWYRLQRLVEPTSTVFLVLSRQRLVTSARLNIVLQNKWTLSTFERENALSSARLEVRRSHLMHPMMAASTRT